MWKTSEAANLVFQWIFVLNLAKFSHVCNVKFLPWIFGHVETRLDQKDKVIFKIYDITTSLKTIKIHILSSISRNKSNQTMKFGQLIEYFKRNIFLQKSCRKWGRETSLCFLRKLYMRQKQVVCTLVSMYLDSPRFGIH